MKNSVGKGKAISSTFRNFIKYFSEECQIVSEECQIVSEEYQMYSTLFRMSFLFETFGKVTGNGIPPVNEFYKTNIKQKTVTFLL